MSTVLVGTAPARAEDPTPPAQLECAYYYYVVELPFALAPNSHSIVDLLPGLAWAFPIVSNAPKAEMAVTAQRVTTVIHDATEAYSAAHFRSGTISDYADMEQPVVDRYDGPCRALAGLPPLDLRALMTAVKARLHHN